MNHVVYGVNTANLFNKQRDVFGGVGEILFCTHCESSKADHLDDGTCLFAPMKFKPMSGEQYMAFLMRPVKEHLDALKSMPLNVPVLTSPVQVTNIAPSYYDPSYYDLGFNWQTVDPVYGGGIIGSGITY